MKAGVYLLNKDTIEKKFFNFSYVPKDYWEEIKFDEVPLYINRIKTKRKGIYVYRYDIKKPFLYGYIEGWKLYVKIEDVNEFEKAFEPGDNNLEWVEKLHAILVSKY